MVQPYIKYPQEKKKFQTLKPNIKKIFLKNVFKVISAVLLIIIFLFSVNYIFGSDVFLVPFESFDIEVNPTKAILYPIFTVLVITIFLLLSNYAVTRNVRYELYNNKLILYKNMILILTKPKEIPFQNIVKISYNTNDIFDKIFNSGTIVLELSGMKESKVELEFIDNVEQTVKYIQSIIQNFRNIQQAQFAEKYKIGKIFDKYQT